MAQRRQDKPSAEIKAGSVVAKPSFLQCMFDKRVSLIVWLLTVIQFQNSKRMDPTKEGKHVLVHVLIPHIDFFSLHLPIKRASARSANPHSATLQLARYAPSLERS
jgi:hypothetical protein